MEVVVVLATVGAVGLLAVGVTFMLQRRNAHSMVRLDKGLTEKERLSGCGACDGSGFRWTALSPRGGGEPGACWRCQGSGEPPTSGALFEGG